MDLEPWFVNSPLRALLQRRYEARVLERLGVRVDGGAVLEIGCGRGVGVEILLRRFGARRVHALDVDAAAVARARRRFAGVDAVDVRVGDATGLDLPDASVDAVFDFAVLHHVPDWRRAVAEVARVLVPGGWFAFSEVTDRLLRTPPMRALTDHPRADRFDADGLVAELERRGIAVGGRVLRRGGGAFVLGAGARRA